MAKIIITILVLVIIGLGAALAYKTFVPQAKFQGGAQIPPKQQNQLLPSPQSSTSNAPNQSPNPMGQDAIIKADTSKDGPWKRDLHIVISNEGKNFRDDKIFEEKSGVPSVIHDKKGKLYAAFQWFPDDNPQAFDKVAIKTSVDGGITWTEPTPAVFNNYPGNFSRPFDPTLVLNPEGTIRMYFTVNKELKSQLTSFYSAISDDGINYTFEEGERFGIKDTQLVDSAGTVFNNTYFLMAPDKNGGAYFATSKDGLTFERGNNVEYSKDYNWTGNVLNYENVIRFYGNSKTPGGKIFYAWTTDGETWSTPTQTNIQGGDPSVVQALESIYLMIYVGPPKK